MVFIDYSTCYSIKYSEFRLNLKYGTILVENDINIRGFKEVHMFSRLFLKNTDLAREILELQINSYKVEAELIDYYDIPPLKDTMDSLIKCDEIFYGYYMGSDLAGIISYKVNGNILDIYRVAVHPEFFRLGIAGKMLDFIERVESNIRKITVSTGKENLPAVSLYLKKGYRKTRDIEIKDNVYITEFEKNC